jgi:DNA-binding response OmpR family regulator
MGEVTTEGAAMLRKALVIEDDANVRENIIDLLCEEGFDPVGAENGRVGLEALDRQRPALILCDIRGSARRWGRPSSPC